MVIGCGDRNVKVIIREELREEGMREEVTG